MKKLSLIFLAVALCACGCHTNKTAIDEKGKESAVTPPQREYTLTQTKWYLTNINGMPVKDSPERPYIIFDGDRVNGSLGCNTFFGTFFANKKGKLDFEYTGATKRLCSDMEVENMFLSALKTDKKSYVIVNNTLIIRGEKMMEDGARKEMEILRFKAED